MSDAAREYYQSGCADDLTVKWNQEALQRLRLESRVMVDVTKIDTRVTLFKHSMPHPILLAPAAAHMLVHPEGELATARGAGAADAIMVASTVSSKSIQEIGRAVTQPLWFQLYVDRDREVTTDLVRRAESAGCQALCLTVDQPITYARDRVSKIQPFMPKLPLGNLSGSAFGNGQTTRTRDLTWKDVAWFKSVTKLPLLLKGILHPQDAEQAVQSGADGIIVSNHGGRALDGVAATIDALPRVTQRVAGRVPVLMDGGIRRGTDIVRALARGANAVLIGRPYLYGLAVNGSEGVRHVVEILRTELETAMALCGKTSLAQIDRSVLWEDGRAI